MAGRAKGGHSGGGGGGGHDGGGQLRWLLTYADLITLLVAFFVVMYSASNADLQKFSRLATSMRTAFHVQVVGTDAFALGQGLGGTGVDLGLEGAGGGLAMILADLPQASRDFVGLSSKMTELAEKGGMGDEIGVNMSREGIIISISAGLIFEPGSADLKESSFSTLSRVADIIRPLPNEIRVEGHTDDSPTGNGHYPTNWDLSVSRAVSVVRYLSEKTGVSPERLSPVGYAQYKPLYPNDTREHTAKNRRAQILILYPTGMPGIDIPLSSEKPSQGKQGGGN